jgi:hypothetical protein
MIESAEQAQCNGTLSSLRQFETFLYPFQPVGHPINALGKLCNFYMDLGKFDMNVRYLALDRADPVLQFANVIPRSVHNATYVAKMLKNNVVGLDHGFELSQKPTALNSDPWL